MNSEVLAHRIRSIIIKLINEANERIELDEEDGQQFVKLDGLIVGKTIEVYAFMDKVSHGLGLADFAELVLILQESINKKDLCREEMIALSEFINEDQRSAWIGIW